MKTFVQNSAADDSLSKYKASTQSLKDELKSVKSNAAMEKTNFLVSLKKHTYTNLLCIA